MFGLTVYKVGICYQVTVWLMKTFNLCGTLFEKWNKLNEQLLESIKVDFTSCLSRLHQRIRKAASFCFVAILPYEMGLRWWREIIYDLIEKAIGQNSLIGKPSSQPCSTYLKRRPSMAKRSGCLIAPTLLAAP